MATQNAAHQKLVSEILAAFGAHPCLLLRKRTVGVFDTKTKRKLKVGQTGEADIDGIWRRQVHGSRVINPNGMQPHTVEKYLTLGVHVAIEVKTGKAVKSAAQVAWAQAWSAMGGVYILARSVEDVYLALRRHPLADWGPSI